MQFLLVYFVIGCFVGLLVELTWPDISPNEPLTFGSRLVAVFGWPVIILIAIGFLLYTEDNDDDQHLGGAY